LLIAAQATTERANALYAASALDLPRRGPVHVSGGMGAVADVLAEAIETHGGRVERKTRATAVARNGNRIAAVETARGQRLEADAVIANLTLPNLARLLGDAAPRAVRRQAMPPADGWGAFVVHCGVDGNALPPDAPMHQQVIADRPLGEGNSVFVSVSPSWDETRAPAGRRAVTISTHTAPDPWWEWLERDRAVYEARKAAMAERVLATAEKAVPGLRAGADPILPGTPVTFERFTDRVAGWVGGYPQTHLLRARAPRVVDDLWLVGDSIFPGQSTAAVALGGLRVADAVMRAAGARNRFGTRIAASRTARDTPGGNEP
jgi:phytoene dehydrogenase-like protein